MTLTVCPLSNLRLCVIERYRATIRSTEMLRDTVCAPQSIRTIQLISVAILVIIISRGGAIAGLLSPGRARRLLARNSFLGSFLTGCGGCGIISNAVDAYMAAGSRQSDAEGDRMTEPELSPVSYADFVHDVIAAGRSPLDGGPVADRIIS